MLEKQELQALLNLLNRTNVSGAEVDGVYLLKRKLVNEINNFDSPKEKEESKKEE